MSFKHGIVVFFSSVLFLPVYLLFGVVWILSVVWRRLKEYWDSVHTEDR